MTLLTSGQKTSQRSDGHKSLVYLSVNKPTTLLTAVVDGVTTRGATAIAFREGSGTTSRIREGQTLRVTIDGRVFTTRVVSFSGTASSGTITVDPNGIAWEDGAGLELVEDYELRVIPPTFDPNTGISTKRGQTYSNQTKPAGIPPVCRMGCHRPAFLPVPTETPGQVSIADTADDGFVSTGSGGRIFSVATSAFIGRDISGNIYSAWFRFGLPIPQGSTMVSAYLEFVPVDNGAAGEDVAALIRAESADNPAAPVSYADYNSRARTSASVAWGISGGWVDGVAEQSPDISAIVQEIVDRGGFAENNAIQFFVEDNGTSGNNYVRVTDYTLSGASQAAKLYVTYIAPVSVDFDIDLTNSKAMAPGASISSYALSVAPATGAAVSFNTATGVGTVTVSQAGQYWLEGSCTDNNGNTHTGHRRVWAHDPDPDSADYPYVDFVVSNMAIGRDGSGSVDVTVHGVADFTEFVDGALVVFWQQAWYGGTEGPISLITGGENILFAGYILADTVDYNWQHGTVKFRAVTPVELMKQFRLQGLSIHAENAPAYWFQYDHRLTVARMLHWHGYWHSTLFDIADVDLPSSTEYKKLFKFNEGTLYSQWQDLASKLFATVGCNKAGQIYVERDIQMLDAAGRAAVDVITEITPADLRETVGIIRRHKNQTNVVRLSGWQFDGQTLTPHCSIAPNKQGADSGPGGQNLDGIVVASQAEANMLTGRVLARENNDVSEARLKFSGNYSALDVAPQRWLTMTLAAGDTPRGIEWTDQRLAIQQIVLGIDQVNGVITTDVVCEPEAFGPDGVDDPCPLAPADETDEPAPWNGEGEGALVAFASINLRPDSASDWTEKHTGDADHGDIDPHWQARQGSVNPNDAIVWWVDGAKIYRSVDGGVTAQDVTPATDPPDTWSEITPAAVENVTFVGVFADRWNQGRFLTLARWQNGSGLWRGWLAVTDDDGLVWSWYPVHGSSLPTQCRPLWLDLNDSHVYVTAWEDGALWLFDFDPVDFSLDASWNLGTVTGSEVDSRTYIAYPRCVLDDSDLVYVFGRMPATDAPISLSGPQHIISYNGTTWASVENGWGADRCVALDIGLDNGGDRKRKAMRQVVA